MTVQLEGLAGKTAVVTGAVTRSGIGRAIALALAAAGCNVAVTSSRRITEESAEAATSSASSPDAREVVEEIMGLGRHALACSCDISQPNDVAALDRRIQSEFGRIDFVVNNAAAERGRDRVPVTELATDEWDKVFGVNLTGTFLMSQTFARRLIKQRSGGAIVNISSIAAKLAMPNLAAYASSKAAVGALTTTMAVELAPFGIRVNAVCPGTVRTARMNDVSPSGWDEIINAIPLGRLGDASEIAAAVTYLCSDRATGITGQSINVDGGREITP